LIVKKIKGRLIYIIFIRLSPLLSANFINMITVGLSVIQNGCMEMFLFFVLTKVNQSFIRFFETFG